MTQTAAISTYGVSLRAVSKWMKSLREQADCGRKPDKRGPRGAVAG